MNSKKLTFIFIILTLLLQSNGAWAIKLTDEEDIIQKEGPISRDRYILGGVMGTTIGFGTGHAIVGKWKEMGWLYTLAETGFLGMMMIGYKKSIIDTVETGFNGNFDGPSYGLMITGYLGFFLTKMGETYDIWNRPHEHNKTYKKVQEKAEKSAELHLLPQIEPKKLALNLSLSF